MSEDETKIVRYSTSDGVDVTLTPRVVLEELVSAADRPTMSDRTVATIMATLQARRMNPLAGDCSIAVFKGRATIMPSIGYYRRQAAARPEFDGIEKGVLAQATDGTIHPVKGAFVPTGWALVGGWARGWRKDRAHECEVRVALEEYDQHNSMWQAKPATMIQKVAESQCLRELFPDAFDATYTREEMPEPDAPREAPVVSVTAAEPVPDFGGTNDEADMAEEDKEN